MNFIREHLVYKILKIFTENKALSTGGFLYLDNPVELNQYKKINRIKESIPFCQEEIIPISWQDVPGKIMIKIWKELNSGKFYAYKTIDGKSYKTRKKRC
jgi:hypothetical protein